MKQFIVGENYWVFPGKILGDCKMKLSILIASLVEREHYLKRILSILESQLTPDVELVVEIDNREITIGAKRQKLLERAKGDYVCHVDEDDIIPPYYVSEILKVIESEPDCVAINGIVTVGGKNPVPFYHSIKYDSWFSKEGIFYRCPNHINPVKRELALIAGFEDFKSGTDHGFSMRLRPLLKMETIIENCFYYYLAGTVLPAKESNIHDYIQSK